MPRISDSTVGCRWKCLWALTWSSARPLAAKASNWARISAASWRRTRGRQKKRKPSRTMREPKRPLASTRSGMQCGGNTAAPSASTRCRPTRKPGQSHATASASGAAGAPTIRLAAHKTPSRWARSTARLTLSCRPKSSAVMIRPGPFTRAPRRARAGSGRTRPLRAGAGASCPSCAASRARFPRSSPGENKSCGRTARGCGTSPGSTGAGN